MFNIKVFLDSNKKISQKNTTMKDNLILVMDFAHQLCTVGPDFSLNAHTYSCWEHEDSSLLEGFPRHLGESHDPALPLCWAAKPAGAEKTAF